MKARLRRWSADPLLRHSVGLLAIAQIGNLANLAFQYLMNRRLPDAEYGVLALMVAVTAMAAFPLDAVRTTVAHRTALGTQEGRPDHAAPVYAHWLRRMLLVWGALAAALALAGPALAQRLQCGDAWPLWITALGLAGVMTLPVAAGALQGLQRFGAFSLATQLPAFVRLPLGAALVVFVARAWTGVAAQSAGFMVAALFAAGCVHQNWRGAYRRGAGGGDIGGVYFTRSLVILGAFSVLMLVDVLLVKAWFDAEPAGRYARAATIARALMYLPMPVAMALFPKVVTRGERTVEGGRMLARALAGAGGLLAASVAVAWIAAPWIWRFFIGVAPGAVDLAQLRWLMLAVAPLALIHLLLHFELAQHRFRSGVWPVLGLAVYLAGAALWHPSPFAVIGWLGGVSLTVLVGLLLAQRPSRRS